MSRAFLTKHARERSHERLGLDPAAAAKHAERALSDGLPTAQMTGSLRRLVDYKTAVHGNTAHTMLYGMQFFVFAGRKLLTAYPVPAEVRTAAAAQWKRWKGRKQ